MAEPLDELIRAAHLCRQNGMDRAAAILGREGAREIRSKRKPRKQGIHVRLANGSPAFLDRDKVREAVEIEG